MHILSLPPEIFLLITSHLDVEDTASFLQTSTRVSLHFAPLLIAYRSPINESCLTGAVVGRYHRLAAILLSYGADVNSQDTLHHMSALHHAALMGDSSMVKLLLIHGAKVDIVGSARCTPLHLAAVGHPEVIRQLVAAGADINFQNEDGATPVYYAASRDRVEETRLLIELGADVTIQDGEGWSALHASAFRGYEEVTAVLMGTGMNGNIYDVASLTPLHYSSFRSHLNTVRMLLDAGVDVDAEDGTGLVAICGAANAGHEDVCRLLLERGAGVGLDNALCCAAVAGRTSIVELLLERQIPAAPGRFDYALRMAAQRGHLGVVELLLDHNVDVFAASPLIGAATHGRTNVVSFLLGCHRYDLKTQALAALNLVVANGGDVRIVEMLESYLDVDLRV